MARIRRWTLVPLVLIAILRLRARTDVGDAAAADPSGTAGASAGAAGGATANATATGATIPYATANGTNLALPRASSLLGRPPPFDDPDVHRLAPDLATSPNTVVTAYFRLPRSKHGNAEYDRWMADFLSMRDHMVIFTGRETFAQIEEGREHARDRTVIVAMDLEDVPIGRLYPTAFWEDQMARNPERAAHKSHRLFWIWLNKSWCVTQAIRLDFFGSDLYMWSDIGAFREGNYNDKELIRHREVVPPGELLQMATQDPRPPPDGRFFDKFQNGMTQFYHSGTMSVAYADAWKAFHVHFLDEVDRFVGGGHLIVDDQTIMQSACLAHPEACAYVPNSQLPHEDGYTALRHVLHYGGDYTLWRYNATEG